MFLIYYSSIPSARKINKFNLEVTKWKYSLTCHKKENWHEVLEIMWLFSS